MEVELLAYGSHQARISAPDKAGVPTRTHMTKRLATIKRRFGETSVEYAQALRDLNGPDIRPRARAIWDLYLSLQRWRGNGGMAAASLTLPDIEAFERRYGVALTAWQCDCIKALDLAFLATRDVA